MAHESSPSHAIWLIYIFFYAHVGIYVPIASRIIIERVRAARFSNPLVVVLRSATKSNCPTSVSVRSKCRSTGYAKHCTCIAAADQEERGTTATAEQLDLEIVAPKR